MPNNPPLTPSDFQQTCGGCGCVFRVAITWPISYSYKLSQEEDYACPECRQLSKIKSSTKPRISLISGRTDGKTHQLP